jgi:hypothetical protein
VLEEESKEEAGLSFLLHVFLVSFGVGEREGMDEIEVVKMERGDETRSCKYDWVGLR